MQAIGTCTLCMKNHLLLGLKHPEELRLPVLVLAGAQGVRDALQGIHEGTGAVVRGVHLNRQSPGRISPMRADDAEEEHTEAC